MGGLAMTDEERKIVVKWLKSKKGITDINWWLELAKRKDEEAWLVEQAKKIVICPCQLYLNI